MTCTVPDCDRQHEARGYVTPKGTRQCRACRRITTKAPSNQGAKQ